MKKTIEHGFEEGARLNFCSFPRAGSHWVLEMLSGCTKGIFKKESSGWREKINKTHSYHMFRNPVVYMYRHGKDSILSYAKMRHYKLAVQDKTYKGSFDERFLRWIIEKEKLPLRWKLHVEYYLGMQSAKICYVRYEDFLVRPIAMLMVIMRFYGMAPEKLNRDKVVNYLGVEPATRTTFSSAPGITGYLPQLRQVKTGFEMLEMRQIQFCLRWLDAEEWTEGIDRSVNKVIGSTLLKYGYLP